MSPKSGRVRLDLNNPPFQRSLFALQKDQQRAVLNTLGKILDMSWDQVYKDPGLKWELISSRTGDKGERAYTLRIGKGFRAVAYREGDWLRLISLHPDHDSAYER
jgi:hypothetical protein